MRQTVIWLAAQDIMPAPIGGRDRAYVEGNLRLNRYQGREGPTRHGLLVAAAFRRYRRAAGRAHGRRISFNQDLP